MSKPWRHIKLGEALDVVHGYAFPSEGMSETLTGNPIIVSIGNFDYRGGFRFDSTRIREFNEDYPKQFNLAPGDLLVAMTCQTPDGEILGLPGMIPNDSRTYLHNQRIGKVITDSTLLSVRFAYYCFLRSDVNRQLVATASGTKILHTAPSRIGAVEIDLPSVQEQEAIADVLGALDDKIAVNDQIARISDELIRQQYADMSARANGEIKLSDIGIQIRDSVPAGSLVDDDNYIGLEHMPRRNIWLGDWGSAKSIASAKSRFRRGDILFGRLRPYFHKVGIAFVDGVSSTDILVMRPVRDSFRGWLLAALSSDDVVARASAVADGTRMPRARWADLANCQIPWDGNEGAIKFNNIIIPLVGRVGSGVTENKTLMELRDLLLPRLMSGEIRVREAAKVVEEVT